MRSQLLQKERWGLTPKRLEIRVANKNRPKRIASVDAMGLYSGRLIRRISQSARTISITVLANNAFPTIN